ncbi:unnamed protein product [Arabis nemorensis]|uniref:Uncharacterized protein n=1 Tax=Arabis nemorensis TaxID=586526 RepID=A0A565BB01_9BRAS|nr:unnamed protein product [Arabis nemorensis]
MRMILNLRSLVIRGGRSNFSGTAATRRNFAGLNGGDGGAVFTSSFGHPPSYPPSVARGCYANLYHGSSRIKADARISNAFLAAHYSTTNGAKAGDTPGAVLKHSYARRLAADVGVKVHNGLVTAAATAVIGGSVLLAVKIIYEMKKIIYEMTEDSMMKAEDFVAKNEDSEG